MLDSFFLLLDYVVKIYPVLEVFAECKLRIVGMTLI